MTEQDKMGDNHLSKAVRRILRPLVRILLRNGVTAAGAQELLRKTFVDVAYEEFGIAGKQQSLTRVSVLTGLSRKEVSRLHKSDPVDDSDKAWWNRAGTVLIAWMSDAAYHTKAGYPLDLPFAGESPNFSDLVRQYSGDMSPRPVADELVRTGAVSVIDGKYRLSARGYVPTADPALMFDILGADTAELIETIDFNIQADDDNKLLQYKLVANNLPEEHLAAFNTYSKRVAKNAFDDIASWLNEHDLGKDETGDDARYAAGVSMFQINRLMRPGRE